ncbi:MAG: electron transport complex subunit E [Thioalkalivibrionaceae bacterium]
MSSSSLSAIARDGLWINNPGLVQLLGLCPLLAITNSVINAVGLALATTLTLVVSNGLVASMRHGLRPEIRIPIFVLIIASTVTAIELLMSAYLYELYLILGIFIPLIVTNCAIIARAEAFASRNPILPSMFDGLMMGLGFSAVLIVLGGFRELLGQGTLLANAHLLFGDIARTWTITLTGDQGGFLLALLPPGAFMAMGLLIAIKNGIDRWLEARLKAEFQRAGSPSAKLTETA